MLCYYLGSPFFLVLFPWISSLFYPLDHLLLFGWTGFFALCDWPMRCCPCAMSLDFGVSSPAGWRYEWPYILSRTS